MTIPSKPATELLITALTAGDAQTQLSFRETLDRASRTRDNAQREELAALSGILDGMSEAGAGKALEPTLRHLLARVL